MVYLPVNIGRAVVTAGVAVGEPLVIEAEQVQKLLNEGKTDLLHRFISKKGRPFSAFLTRGADGKVSFEFAPREAKVARPKGAARARKTAAS